LESTGGIGDVSNEDNWNELLDKHPKHELDEEAIEALKGNHQLIPILAGPKLMATVKESDTGAATGFEGWTAGMIFQVHADEEMRGLLAKLFSILANGNDEQPILDLFLPCRMTP